MSASDAFEDEEDLTVGRIFFKGNDVLDKDDILPHVFITERPWSVWGDAQKFQSDKLDKDRQRIITLYKRAGYFETRVVDIELALIPDAGSVDVTFVIDEGKPVTVTEKTRIVYPRAATEEVRALEEESPLVVGDVFSVSAYERGLQALRQRLRGDGFYQAEVTPAAWVFPERYAASVTYIVKAGPRVHFGPAELLGANKYSDDLIMREIVWEQGEWWDARKVEKTIQDLYGLNLFRVVKIDPKYPGAATDPMPVVITVSESPAQSFRVGVGYGTEERFRSQARYQHYNLLGGGRNLSLLLRYSFLLQGAEATLLQPYVLAKENQVSLSTAYRRETIVDAFSYERYTLSPRFHRRISAAWKGYSGYKIEYNRAFEIIGGIPLENRSSADPGLLSAIVAGLERTTVDSLLTPSYGNVARLDVTHAGRFMGGAFDFYKAELESIQFFQPLRRVVIALRGKAGVAAAYADSRVPIYEKFYSGGSSSVRGYRRDRLGPQIGGLSLVEATAEIRRRIQGDFWVAGFVDMGMVGLEEYSWEPNQVRWGVGPGLRLSTIVGLIKADVGVPLDPRIGEPAWRFHLSIGQTL